MDGAYKAKSRLRMKLAPMRVSARKARVFCHPGCSWSATCAAWRLRIAKARPRMRATAREAPFIKQERVGS